MAEIVLVMGAFTGYETAKKVAEVISATQGLECQPVTYGWAVTHEQKLKAAVAKAEWCIAHSQGSLPVIDSEANDATLVCPPLSGNGIDIAFGLAGIVNDFVTHPDLAHGRIAISGLGETVRHGLHHLKPYWFRRLGGSLIKKAIRRAEAGAHLEIVQCANDRITPLISDPDTVLPYIGYKVIPDADHNTFLFDTARIVTEITRIT